jgi:hypothetical protein
VARKPVSIKAARNKRTQKKRLSYWQEKLPGRSGLEHCNVYHTVDYPEGDDWKPDGWTSMWDMIIAKLRPGVIAAADKQQAA